MADSNFTTQELENEIWKPVVGFENVYSVSNLGRVRRELTRGRAKAGHIFQPSLNKQGYPSTWLTDINKRINAKIHHLVMRAFVGERPEGYEVNHINANRADNRLENLEYVTHAQNIKHAAKLGRMRTTPWRKGIKGPMPHQSSGLKHSEIIKKVCRRGDNHSSRVNPSYLKRGTAHHGAKLTEEDVKAIRDLRGKERQHITAQRFNVSRQTITRIQSGQAWKHL
jgi:hypothetical protein